MPALPRRPEPSRPPVSALAGLQDARPEKIVLSQWKGQNNLAGRSEIDDQELYWSENLFPVGPSNLAALPDAGVSIYASPAGVGIASFACYVRGTQRYAIVFLSDGSAVEVSLPSGTTTSVAPAATFAPVAPYFPRIASWANEGIVIVSSQANGYWAWDGTLHKSGDSTSPTWLNGGTATAMPTGVSGNAVIEFQSRAIIVNGNQVQISAPENGATFAASAGGDIFTSSDSFLQQTFMDVQQSAGFVYLFGDSSINAVSDINTTGSTPVVTTLFNANVDPQVGHTFPTPALPFGRSIIFANQNGIYALSGGATQLLSNKLTGLIANLDVTIAPSLGLVDLAGVRCIVALVKCTDVFGTDRTLLLIFNGHAWSVASQTPSLTQIATSMQSSVPQLWGSDGTHLFQCFAGSAPHAARMTTKLYAGADPIAVKFLRSVFLGASGGAISPTIKIETDRGTTTVGGPNGTAQWATAGGAPAHWLTSNDTAAAWSYSGGTPPVSVNGVFGIAAPGAGLLFGFDITMSGSNFSLSKLIATYDNVAEIGR